MNWSKKKLIEMKWIPNVMNFQQDEFWRKSTWNGINSKAKEIQRKCVPKKMISKQNVTVTKIIWREMNWKPK